MKSKRQAYSDKRIEKFNPEAHTLFAKRYSLNAHSRGFTLVETMVAISLLTIAVVAPMTLTTQSLGSAYYARDQITAFHLAQEAIETIRHARDANVLKVALGYTGVNIFDGFPSDFNTNPFTVDTTNNDAMASCGGSPCQRLRKNPAGLYGYHNSDPTWGDPTQFIRAVTVTSINNDEINVSVTVSWRTGSFSTRSFTISENLFRWVKDSSAAI